MCEPTSEKNVHKILLRKIVVLSAFWTVVLKHKKKGRKKKREKQILKAKIYENCAAKR